MKTLWLLIGHLTFASLLAASPVQDSFRQRHQPLAGPAVAQSIWEEMLEHDDAYIDTFIRGMRVAEEEQIVSEWKPVTDGETYLNACRHLRAKRNLESSDALFARLALDEELHSAIPNRVYYRTLEAGCGDQLALNHNACTIQYCIEVIEETSQGFPKAHSSSLEEQVLLSELLPGLVYGMEGMRIGERREIWIHPSLGYGFEAMFEPGVSLRARIEVVELGSETSSSYPPYAEQLLPTPQTVLQIDEEGLERLKEAAALEEGILTWSNIRICQDLYPLEAVIAGIRQLQSGAAILLPSAQQQEVLSLLGVIHCQRTLL